MWPPKKGIPRRKRGTRHQVKTGKVRTSQPMVSSSIRGKNEGQGVGKERGPEVGKERQAGARQEHPVMTCGPLSDQQ